MKNEMKHLHLSHVLLMLLPAAGLLAGACARKEPVTEEEREEIRFRMPEGWQPLGADGSTRATLFAEGALGPGSAFGVDAYLDGTTTKYINSDVASYQTETLDWRFDDNYYWPMSGSLDFMAWMPADRADTYVGVPSRTVSGGPTFTCTNLPLTTAGQLTLQEFVYAWKTGQSRANPGAAGVVLAFRHPFARIHFQLKTAHQALHLNTVTFKTIKQTGTYAHNAPEATPAVASAWTGLSSPGNLTMTFNTDVAAGAALSSAQISAAGLPFLVIPQTLSGTDQIELNLQLPSGTTARTITLSNPVTEWQPGKAYTYSLDLSDEIRFGVTITDWNTGTVYNEIIFTVTAEAWVTDGTNSTSLDFGE